MTTITRHANEHVRRVTMRDLVRRWAAALPRLARWLTADIADMAVAGQLGPDAEAEVSRWTGSRV